MKLIGGHPRAITIFTVREFGGGPVLRHQAVDGGLQAATEVTENCVIGERAPQPDGNVFTPEALSTLHSGAFPLILRISRWIENNLIRIRHSSETEEVIARPDRHKRFRLEPPRYLSEPQRNADLKRLIITWPSFVFGPPLRALHYEIYRELGHGSSTRAYLPINSKRV